MLKSAGGTNAGAGLSAGGCAVPGLGLDATGCSASTSTTGLGFDPAGGVVSGLVPGSGDAEPDGAVAFEGLVKFRGEEPADAP